MADAVIHCQNLTKQFTSYEKEPGFLGSLKALYKRKVKVTAAVADFDVNAEEGEFIGLLGPNGAGKTTLMKMLTGIIVPSHGTLTVLGQEPFQRSRAFRKNIGLVMGQKSQLWWDIPAMDSFLLLQKYYEVEAGVFNKRLGHLGDLLDVNKLLKVQLRKLSLGERMKMELIASILHQPRLLFLDEPTIGLDMVAQANIRAFLIDYQATQKTTIILTSHYMADVEALCKRIILILNGKKAFDDSISTFKGLLGSDKCVTFRFDAVPDQGHPLWLGLDAKWQEDGRSVELRIPEVELRQRSAAILAAFPVVDFFSEKLPLERVMASLLGGQILAPGQS